MQCIARKRLQRGVELIHAAKGEMLMKGSLHTDEVMRSVTAKVGGPAGRPADKPCVRDGRACLCRDPVCNGRGPLTSFPDLDAKRDIIQNAIDLYTQAGFGKSPQGGDPVGLVETVTIQDFHPRSRSAAPLQDGRSRADHWRLCLTDRLPSTTPSIVEAARIKGIQIRGRRPGTDPARS